MSANRIRLDGFDELRAALRELPAELTDDAQAMIYETADSAAADIISAYPRRTGNLKNGVKVVKRAGQFSTQATVKNTAPHAWIFENGTAARHSDLGANRGAMPPGHVFIPRVIRWRRQMYELLRQLVESKGVTVTGEP